LVARALSVAVAPETAGHTIIECVEQLGFAARTTNALWSRVAASPGRISISMRFALSSLRGTTKRPGVRIFVSSGRVRIAPVRNLDDR
jgi:hypothetical protein